MTTYGVVAEDPPPEPAAPQYDPAVYQDLLYRGIRESVREALNGFEDTLADTLEHVGNVLDGRIAAVQPGPAQSDGPPVTNSCSGEEGAAVEGAQSAAEQRAWAVFSLLRQRVALGVRSEAAPLREPATPLRRPVLEFGVRVTGVSQRGGGKLDAGGGGGEAVTGGAGVEFGSALGSGSGMHPVAESGMDGGSS